jgi:hypothetical protein
MAIPLWRTHSTALPSTIVHLLWLEISDQIKLAQGMDAHGQPVPAAERMDHIARHLRLIGAKNKAANLLLRLQEARRKAGLDPLLQIVPRRPDPATAAEADGR